MSRLVVDCSVTMAWCFADESSVNAEAVLAAVLRDGAVVPPIWRWEVANTLLMAERRGRVAPDTRQLIAEVLETLPIVVDDLSWSMAWSETLTIARTHQLTAYDAAYLELASRQSLTLCTLDRELIATAPQLGVALFRTATT